MIAAALLAFKAAAQDLPRPVRQGLRTAGVPASSVSAWVQEVGAPRPSVAARADTAMHPASVMKLVTTYAALELLGPAYRWKTETYVDGEDLFLRGYGDPNLNYESFWLLLRNLRGRGLRELRGDVVLDRSYFGPAQYSAFDSEIFRPYNVTPDALLVNFKSLRFTFIPQGDKGVRVFAEPALPGLEIVNQLKLGDGSCPDGNRAFRELIQASFQSQPPRASFAGTYPLSCGERDLNIALHDPQDYVAAMIRQLWGEMGGTWSGSVRDGVVPPGARLLYVHESEPLGDIVRDINKFSNNVMARQLFLTLGAERGGPPARAEEAARAIKEWMAAKKIDAPELVLENGSGLSRTERISARHLATLLAAAWRSPVMPEFVSSLPVVAADGTMKKRLRGERVAGSAHVKTGLLADARAIAGYVLDRNGRRHVVVMIANHPKAPEADAAMDALLQWVYDSPTAPARPITNRPGASPPRP
ncbi:MAG: D-alanyl-D-alanine carboxypeptidase/D-alanyl-D-alanine-endopeptidase [Betaproteobacteria bacterium]|nr:MAG: D-alanyl-D-alanine carboxypeptidase/D-alanyl-D-alanine-endopeptidase [Betaproteobacteria bacterium]